MLIVPIVFSPIFLFDSEGKAFAITGKTPPSARGFFEPALNASRFSSPGSDIYVILNFKPSYEDERFLKDLRVTAVYDHELLSGKYIVLEQQRRKFAEICPINKHTIFQVIVNERYYWIQALMEKFSIPMILHVETDNLLMTSVHELVNIYQPWEYHFTHSFISAHLSFISLPFLQAINTWTTEFVSYTTVCPFTSAGQDMRLLFEGARYLTWTLQKSDPNAYAKVLNTAAIFPCAGISSKSSAANATSHSNQHNPYHAYTVGVEQYTWQKSFCLPPYKNERGPCNGPLNFAIDRFNALHFDTNIFPKVYECVERNDLAGSLVQTNLKGGNSFITCTVAVPRPQVHEGLQVSADWSCKEPWARTNKNAVLYFYSNMVFGRLETKYNGVSESVRFHNLHFQGGGCKNQMYPVWAAIKRSSMRPIKTLVMDDVKDKRAIVSTTTCEEPGRSYLEVDRCLETGVGEKSVDLAILVDEGFRHYHHSI